MCARNLVSLEMFACVCWITLCFLELCGSQTGVLQSLRSPCALPEANASGLSALTVASCSAMRNHLLFSEFPNLLNIILKALYAFSEMLGDNF